MVAPHNNKTYTLSDGMTVFCDKVVFIGPVEEFSSSDVHIAGAQGIVYKQYSFVICTESNSYIYEGGWVDGRKPSHELFDARIEVVKVKDRLIKWINAYVPLSHGRV